METNTPSSENFITKMFAVNTESYMQLTMLAFNALKASEGQIIVVGKIFQKCCYKILQIMRIFIINAH